MSRPRGSALPGTLPITLAELVRIAPLAAGEVLHLADPARPVEQVVVAETIDRLRRSSPHSLVVLHADAAAGGWSLAAALHLAWERNASAVVVARSVAGPSSAALAQRLNMTLVVIDEQPVEVALQLAGQVSAPDAARALRQALFAERLAEESSTRAVLSALNGELDPVPVALVVGDAVLAGRAAALVESPDAEQVEVDVKGPGERPWAQLVAAVPARVPGAARQVEALLRLARPALLASLAQARLNSAQRAAHEQAGFGLLRQLVGEPPSTDRVGAEIEAPPWTIDLGWHVDGFNRAVWLAPLRPVGPPPEQLTELVRAAWLRARPTWPLVAEDDGWISWCSTSDADDVTVLRPTLTGFRETAAAHGLVIGVGRPVRGVAGLMRSVAEARLAAHVARDSGPGAVQWFDQVGPPAALAWLPTAEIAQVADLCLQDLMAAKDRSTLVDTVLAVLDCGGSLSQASQRLGVHRNTVLTRVARARQLGLDFEDPGQRLSLHVLCHALASLADDQGRTGNETA
ncbi:PucR family transcriptional regulator [Blastococcus mobilis]|uniref:PucR C-terminal helix-turn-helix domain-containing protein n=1 Tax=Blastococcus mobilis TaxID=1938746 RepID=A0A239A8A1_9ACTN|nr:helix-turn-helix domain-containing protein [Blastococcus mobilis]SNR91800.1 PucR C-terminal helix-turn-helix domain-containing protein [Blastococcus mobilis]